MYTRNLLDALFEIDEDNEYDLLLMHEEHRGELSEQGNLNEVLLPAHNKLVWDQWTVPRYADRQNLDLVFNPKLSIPLWCSAETVLVMHGAEQFVVPDAFPFMDRMYFTVANPLYCKFASAIIAMSEVGRQDIARHMGADPEKIRVIPEAYNDLCRVLEPHEAERVKEAHDLPDDFLLFLGGLNPIKNFGRTVRAFHQLRDEYPHDLVVVGFKRWKYEDDLALVEELGLSDRVHFVGYVPDEDIPGFYNLADAFVFPSLYEGFGIPVLEAMACGCPVVASKEGASPEVAGGGAILVDPYDPDDIARGIRKVMTDDEERQRMIERGFERAKQFSWEKTARRTLQLFESLMSASEDGSTG